MRSVRRPPEAEGHRRRRRRAGDQRQHRRCGPGTSATLTRSSLPLTARTASSARSTCWSPPPPANWAAVNARSSNGFLARGGHRPDRHLQRHPRGLPKPDQAGAAVINISAPQSFIPVRCRAGVCAAKAGRRQLLHQSTTACVERHPDVGRRRCQTCRSVICKQINEVRHVLAHRFDNRR